MYVHRQIIMYYYDYCYYHFVLTLEILPSSADTCDNVGHVT